MLLRAIRPYKRHGVYHTIQPVPAPCRTGGTLDTATQQIHGGAPRADSGANRSPFDATHRAVAFCFFARETAEGSAHIRTDSAWQVRGDYIVLDRDAYNQAVIDHAIELLGAPCSGCEVSPPASNPEQSAP